MSVICHQSLTIVAKQRHTIHFRHDILSVYTLENGKASIKYLIIRLMLYSKFFQICWQISYICFDVLCSYKNIKCYQITYFTQRYYYYIFIIILGRWHSAVLFSISFSFYYKLVFFSIVPYTTFQHNKCQTLRMFCNFKSSNYVYIWLTLALFCFSWIFTNFVITDISLG